MTIQKNGNTGAHSDRKLRVNDSLHTVKELFHFIYWMYRFYSPKPHKDVKFDAELIPKDDGVKLSSQQLENIKKELESRDKKVFEQAQQLKDTNKEPERVKLHLTEIQKQKETPTPVVDIEKYKRDLSIKEKDLKKKESKLLETEKRAC